MEHVEHAERMAVGGASAVTPGALETTSTAGEPPETLGRRSARHLREWAILGTLAIVIALVVRTFLVQAFYIPSDSMVPTLERGDRVLVNKLSYKLHDVRRGDVVVFTAPQGVARSGVKDLIKRVIGLPGETVEGVDGQIFIGGKRLEESYLPQGLRSKTFGPVHVPPGEFWVLGDNRPGSQDSTYFGPIKRSAIIGRAFVLVWPIGRVGLL